MATASIQMIGAYLLKRGGFMEIETKYDIGQEVWLFYYGKILKDIITHRMTIAIGSRRDDVVIYRTRNFNNLAEYELFTTKEELLKSL